MNSTTKGENSVRISTDESGWNKDFSFHYAVRTKLPKKKKKETRSSPQTSFVVANCKTGCIGKNHQVTH